jgi:L-threonylcarbamoyladenylate synthase
MTKINKLEIDQTVEFYLQDKKVKEAANVLKSGGVVAFPTETVYGLGANATNEEAVARIFAAKGRPSDNPLIVHVANVAQIERWIGELSPLVQRLITTFSPGPITYVLRHRGNFASNVTAGLNTVGIRIPDHPLALALLTLAEVPVAAPSANRSGRPSPTTAAHVVEDLSGDVDLILDGGPSTVGVESTVIDVRGDQPILLRPGGVTVEELEEVIGEIVMDTALQEKPRSPGMKYRHYAPKAEMWLVSGEDMVNKIVRISQEMILANKRIGVLTTEENKNRYPEAEVVVCGKRSEPLSVAQQLYHALREFDRLEVDLILAETFPTKGIYHSVMNRLQKAAEGRHK